MDPFNRDKDRRRRKNPFDFMDDEEIERIFEEIRRFIQSSDFTDMVESTNFKEMIEDMFRSGFDPNKRFIHGFSMNIGPDGKPRFQEFGNRSTKTSTGEPVISDEREPLTDIIEGDEDVAITVEIPGVDKQDIDLNVTEDILEITVDNPKRKYHKRVDIPCNVKPKTTKATYKNGVLDVVVKRKGKKKPGEGYRVNIG